MRGLFSARPGQAAIRLLIGTHLLLLVQAGLVLWTAPEIDLMLRIIVGIAAILGLLAFAVAAHGGTIEDDAVWTPRRGRRRS
jgi:uncharacterized membrane protein